MHAHVKPLLTIQEKPKVTKTCGLAAEKEQGRSLANFYLQTPHAFPMDAKVSFRSC